MNTDFLNKGESVERQGLFGEATHHRVRSPESERIEHVPHP